MYYLHLINKFRQLITFFITYPITYTPFHGNSCFLTLLKQIVVQPNLRITNIIITNYLAKRIFSDSLQFCNIEYLRGKSRQSNSYVGHEKQLKPGPARFVRRSDIVFVIERVRCTTTIPK